MNTKANNNTLDQSVVQTNDLKVMKESFCLQILQSPP